MFIILWRFPCYSYFSVTRGHTVNRFQRARGIMATIAAFLFRSRWKQTNWSPTGTGDINARCSRGNFHLFCFQQLLWQSQKPRVSVHGLGGVVVSLSSQVPKPYQCSAVPWCGVGSALLFPGRYRKRLLPLKRDIRLADSTGQDYKLQHGFRARENDRMLPVKK